MKAYEARILGLVADGWTFEQIARAFNVSPERVRQVFEALNATAPHPKARR